MRKIFAALLFSSTLALAKQNFLPNISRQEGACPFGTVLNEKQRGIGWVISIQNKLYVITPAHVTSGLGSQRLRCEQHFFNLKAVGESPTYDLALFEILRPTSTLTPALVFEDEANRKASLETQKFIPFSPRHRADKTFQLIRLSGGEIFIPVPRKESTFERLRSSTGYWTSSVMNDLSPVYGEFVLHTAIQPGMSGSPVMAPQGSRLVGMALKVQINGSTTLAISTQDILSLIPDLLQGQDPWRKAYPQAPYYAYIQKNSQRTKAILFPLEPQEALTESCDDSSFQSASGIWSDSAGGIWGDTKGGIWGDSSGGIWGDGGSPRKSSNGDFITGSHYYQMAYYKSQNRCRIEGIQFLRGGEIATAIKPTQIGLKSYAHLKTPSLGALFPQLLDFYFQNQKNFSVQKLKQRLVWSSDTSFEPYCTPHGFTTKQSFYHPQMFLPTIPASTRDNPNVDYFSMIAHTSASAGYRAVYCSPKTRELHYHVDFSREKLPNVVIDFQRVENIWKGSFRFGRCTENFSIPAEDPWRFSIRSQDLLVHVTLNGMRSDDARVLSLRVLKASSNCVENKKDLYLFDFLRPLK